MKSSGVMLLCGLLLLPWQAWPATGLLRLQASRGGTSVTAVSAPHADLRQATAALDFRLMMAAEKGHWAAEMHYEWLAATGVSIRPRHPGYPAGAWPDESYLTDDRRLLDLSATLASGDDHLLVQRLDRLALGYRQPSWLLRVGRQALSWGNGLVFQPLDFLNPFAPMSLDKDYKPGDDMIYGQYLFDDGSDMQAVFVGRRGESGAFERDESTLAIKGHLMDAGLDLLLARHYAETRIGLGWSHDVGTAVARLDIDWTPTLGSMSLVANIDYAWNWQGRTLYGFAEYYHDSLGGRGSEEYARLESHQIDRLLRGERYNLGRDYLAAGLLLTWYPLLDYQVTVIANLNDGSQVWQARVVYDWREDVELMAGLELAGGASGTEFGGGGDAGPSVTPGDRVYLRLSGYF